MRIVFLMVENRKRSYRLRGLMDQVLSLGHNRSQSPVRITCHNQMLKVAEASWSPKALSLKLKKQKKVFKNIIKISFHISQGCTKTCRSIIPLVGAWVFWTAQGLLKSVEHRGHLAVSRLSPSSWCYYVLWFLIPGITESWSYHIRSHIMTLFAG